MASSLPSLDDADVHLVGVEPAGEGCGQARAHAATITMGKPGEIHGMKMLCAGKRRRHARRRAQHCLGLDYPGVGPQHSYLKDNRPRGLSIRGRQGMPDAFMTLSRVEGIIPALESAHAVAWAMREAPKLGKDQHILVNLSGRGDKDADYVAKKLGCKPEATQKAGSACFLCAAFVRLADRKVSTVVLNSQLPLLRKERAEA